MRRISVRVVRVLSGCIAVAFLSACKGAKGTAPETQPPGIGLPVQLALVDGKPLPAVIASTASDQTVVVTGKAVLGEAIATGPYMLSLRHTTATTVDTSNVSGTTFLVRNGSTVTATIDLGAALGKHTYTFSF